ncbi:MAG: MBL fold metallo-hydrolase [Synergistetes bacterium]|nr:MBL fold metallo-hydrolase [Synergistota bacterium]MCX8127162.1 MBL fold metallo-hydrolase [Synergistota bacterium]MDW8191952.1 MBL fold metallo-hydrolase [Synergistota bacterium]
MRIEWLGHACFLIETRNGVKIITDPYDPALGYPPIRDEADIVLVSHDHFDHNYVEGVKGNPYVVMTPELRTIKGVSISGVELFHDRSAGRERGKNIAFIIDADGLRLVHLGDLGHVPTPAQLSNFGRVDVLFIPVGGFYTIDGGDARKILAELNPKIAIPMHFKTPVLGFPISGVEPFLSGLKNVEVLDRSWIEVDPYTLPKETKLIVMQYRKG